MKIIIDKKSGFCFGVKKAIENAETELKKGDLYCLGDIVHNDEEVKRLEKIGLKVIDQEKFFTLKDCRVLIRAHGEPPATYIYAKENNIEIIDGTCPVVSKLQDKIRIAHSSLNGNGSVIIFGKSNHPEVKGLNGQIDNSAVIIQSKEDLHCIDYSKPVILFAQTTMSRTKYWELKMELEKRLVSPDLLESNDSICGQVANRGPWLEDFSKHVDAVIFVGGQKSSNSKVLFSHCRKANKNSYFVSSKNDIHDLPLKGQDKIGICGATSTPMWLMEEIADNIKQNFA